jgi:DedD protein
VERQLQERLTGAAVLILIAVVLVPEMFSGPKSRSVVSPDAVNTAQVKTYEVELEPRTDVQVPAPVQPVEVDVRPIVPALTPPTEEVHATSMSQSSSSAATQSSVSSASKSAVSASSASSVASQRSSAKASVSSSAKSVQSQPNKAASNGKWAIQIGSFSTKQRAQEVISKLNGMGIKANVAPITSGGKTLYRVRSSAFADRAATTTALKKVESTFPGASVVSLN